MDKKLKQIFQALVQLPDLSNLGNLKVFHIEILKIIYSNDDLSVKDLISHPSLESVSQAQRYRYIEDLKKLNYIHIDTRKKLQLT